LPGQHGKEGAYAALRVAGKLVGAPDRAVSYPANPWEASSADVDRNYTYYMPATPDMVGKEIEVVVLGFQESDVKPEVWLTAYPIPYAARQLILTER
jgi:hypothetical protein